MGARLQSFQKHLSQTQKSTRVRPLLRGEPATVPPWRRNRQGSSRWGCPVYRECAGCLPQLGQDAPVTVTWGRSPPEAGALPRGPQETLWGAGRRLCEAQADATSERGPPPAPSPRDTLGLCCPQRARVVHGWRAVTEPQAGSAPAIAGSLCRPGEERVGRRWLHRCPCEHPTSFPREEDPSTPSWEQSRRRPKSIHPWPRWGHSQPASPALRSEGRFLLVSLPAVGAESGNDGPPAPGPRAGCSETNPGFPGGKESTCQAGAMGPIPGSERCPGGGHDHPLQYSHLENPRDRGAWRAAVHRVSKSRTRLSY